MKQPQIYLNRLPLAAGKELPANAIPKGSVHIQYYETPEYAQEQAEAARRFFGKLSEDRAELEARHG